MNSDANDMEYILKPHARKRMRERGISDKAVKDAVDNPSWFGYDSKGRMLIKKLYRRGGKERLLLIAGESTKNILEIITVIETSKIKKYL